MNRGEVWWADLPPPWGHRPVLLIARNAVYQVRTTVTIAPLTSTIRPIASQVVLTEEDGVPHQCVVNLDDITTVQKRFLQRRITVLSDEKIKAVEAAIHFALGLET